MPGDPWKPEKIYRGAGGAEGVAGAEGFEAGVGGAAAGAEAAVDPGALSPEPLAGAAAAGAASEPESPPDGAGGFAEPYPSLYHPPPAKWTAGAVMVRSSSPAQKGQTVISTSENFWIFSVRRWH